MPLPFSCVRFPGGLLLMLTEVTCHPTSHTHRKAV